MRYLRLSFLAVFTFLLIAGLSSYMAIAAVLDVPTGYPTIQGAIDAAAAGDTVQVACGTYYENITLKTGVIVQGSGADCTTIDGSQLDRVVTAVGVTNAVISGFTITNGKTIHPQGSSYQGYGAGILLYSGAQVTISDNIISNNITQGSSGGGIALEDSCTAWIENNYILNNGPSYGGGGILSHYGSSTTVINNVIAGNTSLQSGGGGFYASDGSHTLVNNTITNNSTEYDTEGAGIHFFTPNTSSTIVNNIVYGNFATLRSNHSDLVNGYATYSNIGTGETSGTGNISVYPMFVDAAGGNFRLAEGSPSIDTGTNAAPSLPTVDLDGNSRSLDGDGDGVAITDMGAYEAQAQGKFPFDVDLVAYWPFDDNTDSTPNDLAPGGIVFDEAQFVAGAGYQGGTDLPPIPGNVDALDLSGPSDYLNVPDSIDLDLTDDYTLSLWIKPSGEQDGLDDVLRKEDISQNTGYGIEVRRQGGNVYASGWKNGVGFLESFRCWGEYPVNLDALFPLDADTWQHVVVSKTGGMRDVYVNAVLTSSCIADPPVGVGTNNAPLQMGAFMVYPERNWNGQLDDVRIYKRGLTAEEIEVIYEGSITVANAGPDQTVDEGNQVILDGTGSEGTAELIYNWTQLAGPIVTMDFSDPVHPTFTAPYVGLNTTLTFELLVDDGGTLSDPDTVDITVVNINMPPIADAGDDDTIKEGAIATLDGSNSYDPEGDTPLGYVWTQTDGPSVTLQPNNTVVDPSFTAPLGIGNQLIFELLVDDGKEYSETDEVVITVVENSQPVADAGPDQTKDEGSLVALDGTGSSDSDGGDILFFQWTQTGGIPVVLSDSTSSNPTFNAPAVTSGGEDVTFALIVMDNDPINPLASLPDYVTIHLANINDPPSCNLAVATPQNLWPPNHKMISVAIDGVMDEDSVYNDVVLIITEVTQDEPVNGLGDGDSSPDAVVQPGNTADTVLIRAERSGEGNGRVYWVDFIAGDGFENCTGSVGVTVPQNRTSTAIDDGQAFDSTIP